MSDRPKFYVDRNGLPNEYPTHLHDNYFWECLGRTVASFGFLEGTLTKAIFAITATTEYSEEEMEKEYDKWFAKIEKSLSDQLNALIDTYGKAVKNNSQVKLTNLEDLLAELREAAKIRNVLCHGSWGPPDRNNASVPFFVNRQKLRFKTPIDIEFLQQVQKHITELICDVIDSVTQMGWQFPSTGGPGEVIWRK
jgi:uncharacterized protein (DUF2132 family)